MGLVLYLALGVTQDGKHGPENCHITGGTYKQCLEQCMISTRVEVRNS